MSLPSTSSHYWPSWQQPAVELVREDLVQVGTSPRNPWHSLEQGVGHPKVGNRTSLQGFYGNVTRWGPKIKAWIASLPVMDIFMIVELHLLGAPLNACRKQLKLLGYRSYASSAVSTGKAVQDVTISNSDGEVVAVQFRGRRGHSPYRLESFCYKSGCLQCGLHCPLPPAR